MELQLQIQLTQPSKNNGYHLIYSIFKIEFSNCKKLSKIEGIKVTLILICIYYFIIILKDALNLANVIFSKAFLQILQNIILCSSLVLTSYSFYFMTKISISLNIIYMNRRTELV